MGNWPTGKVVIATEKLYDYIRGKKIALMINTSAIENGGKFIMDTIIEEKIAQVPFFFAMEHGVRGNFDAGSSDITEIDEKTGVRIINLFECAELLPPIEYVREVDAVVFCAQDVGVRHWTFTTMMMALIEICAEAGTEVIVLDRPNPLRGDIVEGEIPKKYIGRRYITGYGNFSYPLRHGMTIGELAVMYNETQNVGAKLTVFKMEGWKRDMWYEDTGLMWTPPTPNTPTAENVIYYATAGLLQGGNFSLGRKTTTPYQFIGSEYFCGEDLAKELNSRDIPGVYFSQRYLSAETGSFKANNRGVRLCDGIMINIYDKEVYRPVKTQLHIIDALIKLYHNEINLEDDKWHGRMRMCTDDICISAKEGKSVLPLIEKWEKSAEEFMKLREKYLLY